MCSAGSHCVWTFELPQYGCPFRRSTKLEIRTFRIMLPMAAALLIKASVGAQTGPTIWVAASLHRVGLTDAPSSINTAQIAAARNGHAAFQVVVNAPASGLSNVNLTISDLRGPGTLP